MKPITLNDWYVPDLDPFAAPEIKGGIHLIGTRATDNIRIVTSEVISCTKLVVRTNSGRLYTLGTVSQHYLDWMQKNNIVFDPANPIKIKEYLK
jgi:hypothetical protein